MNSLRKRGIKQGALVQCALFKSDSFIVENMSQYEVNDEGNIRSKEPLDCIMEDGTKYKAHQYLKFNNRWAFVIPK